MLFSPQKHGFYGVIKCYLIATFCNSISNNFRTKYCCPRHMCHNNVNQKLSRFSYEQKIQQISFLQRENSTKISIINVNSVGFRIPIYKVFYISHVDLEQFDVIFGITSWVVTYRCKLCLIKFFIFWLLTSKYILSKLQFLLCSFGKKRLFSKLSTQKMSKTFTINYYAKR